MKIRNRRVSALAAVTLVASLALTACGGGAKPAVPKPS